MNASAPQRRHGPPEIFNVLHWLVRGDAPQRLLPNAFRPGGWSTNKAALG
ncbi:hypothetical protein [Nitrococcus mobilis]|nr:hypothetical protein [Nitrococcus mobilis]